MRVIREFKGEYRWLSNFWWCKVVWEGIEFPTAEHAYQASKAKDISDKLAIRVLETPGKAKRAGKLVERRDDFEANKIRIMEEILTDKFTRNSSLRVKLEGTKELALQEGNNWGDTFWGIDLRTGEGRNELGKTIMRIRERLLRSAVTGE